MGNQLEIDSLGLNLLHVILECSNRGTSGSEFSLGQAFKAQTEDAGPPMEAFEGDGRRNGESMGESMGNQLGIDSLGLNLLHVILECSNRGSSGSEFSLVLGL